MVIPTDKETKNIKDQYLDSPGHSEHEKLKIKQSMSP